MNELKNCSDATNQDHDGTGHLKQSTSRLAPLGFLGNTATSAHFQVQNTNTGCINQKAASKKIGTYNVQGLLSATKQLLLLDDFFKYNLKALLVQETHIQGHGYIDIRSTHGKIARLYYTGRKSKSTQGVGVLIDPRTKCEFTPVSSRIMKLTIKSDDIKTNLISAYAPTNKLTETHPENTARFYNKLSSVVNKIKKKEALVIGGDFNAKTKENSQTKSKSTGKYARAKLMQMESYCWSL